MVSSEIVVTQYVCSNCSLTFNGIGDMGIPILCGNCFELCEDCGEQMIIDSNNMKKCRNIKEFVDFSKHNSPQYCGGIE